MANRSSRRSRGEEPFYRALGHLLRSARLNAGLSLDALAVLVDEDRWAICSKEHGRRAGTAQQYYALATVLRVDPGHVLRMAAIAADVQTTV